jgi:hypothetical protein
MCEIAYDKDQLEKAINEMVPQYQRDLVAKALDIDAEKNNAFDEIGLLLTGEKREAGFVCYTAGTAKTATSMWCFIKNEIYDYLCTSSRKYTAERKDAGATIKNVITIIATAVAAHFNIAVGVIVGAVTVALISALKIGQHAWCAAVTV